MKKKKRVDLTRDPDGFYFVPGCVTKNKELTDSSVKVFSYIFSLWSSCDNVHPSTEMIMEMTRLTNKSVRNAKRQLVQLGLITEVTRGNGRGNSTEYQVNASRVNEFFGVELCETEKQPIHNKRLTDEEYYEKFRKKKD